MTRKEFLHPQSLSPHPANSPAQYPVSHCHSPKPARPSTLRMEKAEARSNRRLARCWKPSEDPSSISHLLSHGYEPTGSHDGQTKYSLSCTNGLSSCLHQPWEYDNFFFLSLLLKPLAVHLFLLQFPVVQSLEP